MKKVLVISHERSGTHFLLNSIALNFKSYDTAVHSFPEKHPEDLHRAFRRAMNDDEVMLLKSHHQFLFFDGWWNEVLENCVVLYMMRNPLDVMVSSWYYHNNAGVDAFPRETMCLSYWLRLVPHKYPYDGMYSIEKARSMPHRWGIHARQWANAMGVVPLTYEQLYHDFDKELGVLHGLLREEPYRRVQPDIRIHKSVCPRKGVPGDGIATMDPMDVLYCWREINGG